MARAAIGHPDGAKVGELNLQALNVEPQRRSARERERDDTAGRARLGKFHRQEVQHLVLAGGVHILAFAGEHALEAQRRPAAA